MHSVDPRDEADLRWFFDDAQGVIKALPSLHAALEARLRIKATTRHPPKSVDGTIDVGLRCGPIYVPTPSPVAHACHFDGRALGAATRERRIRRAIQSAGDWAELVLRLRYREVITVPRFAFGGASSGRGPGMLAHLTEPAVAAWQAARTTLEVGRWTDRLGAKLATGKASVADRALQREVRRETERLVLVAYGRYRRGFARVPEIVRRAALARSA